MFFMSFSLVDFLITYFRVLWAWLIYRLTLKICILVAVHNKLIPDLSAGETVQNLPVKTVKTAFTSIRN